MEQFLSSSIHLLRHEMPRQHAGKGSVFCTIGHSTHPLDVFIDLLQANPDTRNFDLRTLPRTGRGPLLNMETLLVPLSNADIKNTHSPGLGGPGRPRHDSLNGGWQNFSFRGYAGYVPTRKFAANLDQVLKLGARERYVLMRAVATPLALPPPANRRCIDRARRTHHSSESAAYFDAMCTPSAVITLPTHPARMRFTLQIG